MKIENGMIIDEFDVEMPLRFKSEAEIADPKYVLYAWVNEHPGEWWYVKIGSAKARGVNERLKHEQGVDACHRVVGLWPAGLVKGYDGPLHKKLKPAAKASSLFKHANDGKRGGTMTEVYMFKSLAGLREILSIVDEAVGCKNVQKVVKPLFNDIAQIVSDIANDESEKFVLDLPPRFGKTRTALELVKMNAKRLCTKVSVMMCYVGTSKKSYAEELATNLAYDGIELVDPDTFESEKECEKHIRKLLEEGKHVLYYFALTGSNSDEKSCFKRRLAPLLKLCCKMDMYVDEADFGAKTENNIGKINKAWKKLDCVKFYGMTGTNASCIQKMWPNEKLSVYKRDYVIDILKAGKRDGVVGIAWHVLDNASLAEAISSRAAMENFSGMCEVIDGHLRDEAYFKQLLRWLYLNEAAFDPRKFREQAKARLVDPSFATMVFLPNDKACHHVFARLVEESIPGARAVVVNGDETTNAGAEELVKCVIKDNARQKGIDERDPRAGRGVFIIAAGMANRSFSIKEIKNILLFVNSGEYWSIAQKIARGFTPYVPDPNWPFTENDPRKTCNVIDFRLAWQFPRLSDWLSGFGMEVLQQDSHMTETDAFTVVHEIAKMTSKITFDEYRWSGLDPVKKLDEKELLVMMQTRDFQKARMVQLADLDALPEPKRCELDEAVDIALTMSCSNVKGDSSARMRRVKLASGAGQQDNGSEDEVKTEVDWKLQHLNFIWNHADWFSTPRCKTLSLALSHMSAARKKEYEKQFGIDMDFICKLVEHLESKHFEIQLSEIS